MEEKLRHALELDGVMLPQRDLASFAHHLDRSIRNRKLHERRGLRGTTDRSDILHWICAARDASERDEALWRSFLAAHFGRNSASAMKERQLESAAHFLCGFGEDPHWTWNRVNGNRSELREWLLGHQHDLDELAFGNHRKFESKNPARLFEVIDSFVCLVITRGGTPARLFDVETDSPERRFEVLFERLRPLNRFGRTGIFDFLSALADLQLIEAEPGSCHLIGATGPLRGARRLWGLGLSDEKLEELADHLSLRLGFSPRIVEDALCNWQKGLFPPGGSKT